MFAIALSTDNIKYRAGSKIGSRLGRQISNASNRFIRFIFLLEVLQLILNINNFILNVAVALRIASTIPVSVASGERSFSKLKVINN
jgi:hypothetical protein